LFLSRLTSVYTKVPGVVVGTLIVAVFPDVVGYRLISTAIDLVSKCIRRLAFDPVNVMVRDPLFWQTVAFPAIVADGKGFTITVIDPLTALLQVLPTRFLHTHQAEYVNVPAVFVGAEMVTLLPLVVVTV
jgi:hypothetical protein